MISGQKDDLVNETIKTLVDYLAGYTDYLANIKI